MQTRSSPPPSSSKPPFPLIARSESMKRLIHEAVNRTTAHHIIPLIIGTNRHELLSFFQFVMARKGFGSGYAVIRHDESDIMRLEREDFRSILVLKGEDLSFRLQEAFANGRLQHLRAVMVVVEKNPFLTRGGPTKDGVPCWTEGFVQFCTRTLTWPAWDERRADQTRLLLTMYRRLRMPNDGRRPPLLKDVARYLLATPFRGTDDACYELKRGFGNYIRAGARGELGIRHFVTPEEMHAHAVAHGEAPVDTFPPPP